MDMVRKPTRKQNLKRKRKGSVVPHAYTYVGSDHMPSTKRAAYLGAGVFGTTYRMRSKLDQRLCAVKQTTSCCRAEAEHLALTPPHPNVTAYFGCRRGKRGMWIVLELVGSGATVVPRRDHPHRIQVLVSVARALAHLHTHNLVHRDVKCTNVFLSSALPGGRVVLGDLGLAAPTNDDGMYAHTDAAPQGRGHRVYRAPEVTDGRPYGRAADMYALGGMLFELVLGQSADAVVGNSTSAGWHRGLAGWLRTLEGRETLEDVRVDCRAPDGVPVASLRLLAENPEDRPCSADVVRHFTYPIPTRCLTARETPRVLAEPHLPRGPRLPQEPRRPPSVSAGMPAMPT